MAATDHSSEYYLDEATKRLARKRQLARLLEEQSMKFSLVNPHARASWTNVAAPLMEAWAGKKIGEEADVEGKKYQEEQAADLASKWAVFRGQPKFTGEAPQADMNLPGDLRQYAGQDVPMEERGVPTPVAPSGPPLVPTLGQQMAQDQTAPPTTPPLKDLPPFLPTMGTQQEPGTPMVPKPVAFNVSGTPQQQAASEAIARADMAKRGETGPLVRGTASQITAAPEPPPEPTPPPPQEMTNLKDMAPAGLILPGTKGRNPDSYDMMDFAMSLAPGRQRDEMVKEAFKNSLTEPDRRQAQIEKMQARADAVEVQREAIRERARSGNLTREQKAESDEKDRELKRELGELKAGIANAGKTSDIQFQGYDEDGDPSVFNRASRRLEKPDGSPSKGAVTTVSQTGKGAQNIREHQAAIDRADKMTAEITAAPEGTFGGLKSMATRGANWLGPEIGGAVASQNYTPDQIKLRSRVGREGAALLKELYGVAVSRGEGELAAQWMFKVGEPPEVIADKIQGITEFLRSKVVAQSPQAKWAAGTPSGGAREPTKEEVDAEMRRRGLIK